MNRTPIRWWHWFLGAALLLIGLANFLDAYAQAEIWRSLAVAALKQSAAIVLLSCLVGAILSRLFAMGGRQARRGPRAVGGSDALWDRQIDGPR